MSPQSSTSAEHSALPKGSSPPSIVCVVAPFDHPNNVQSESQIKQVWSRIRGEEKETKWVDFEGTSSVIYTPFVEKMKPRIQRKFRESQSLDKLVSHLSYVQGLTNNSQYGTIEWRVKLKDGEHYSIGELSKEPSNWTTRRYCTHTFSIPVPETIFAVSTPP